MDNFSISPMCIKDLDEIKTILCSDFDDFWNYNTFKSELENTNSHYIIAKTNGKIVGFAGIWDGIDQMHITNIVVHKKYRKNKIGSKLLEQLIILTKQYNHKFLTLEVNEKNIIAQKLYLKYNFKILGKRKNYYNNIDNAVIMTLSI